MTISRRGFFRVASAGAATFLGQSHLFAAETQRFVNPLRIPPLLESAGGPDGKAFDLGVAAGISEFLPGVSTPTLGINGAYLVPQFGAVPVIG